jgi:tRNA threonylcarbamoyl adenosine modification protein YeaZ
LLPNIDRMLDVNGSTQNDIGLIIVSTGPGSYTGIRIGLATVLGLRAGLGVPCVGMTALQAISSLHVGEQPVIAAVPMGRDLVCVQTFQNCIPKSEPRVISESELSESIVATGFALVAHADICTKLSDQKLDIPTIDAGRNIASHLCSSRQSNRTSTDLSPLFVERNSV